MPPNPIAIGIDPDLHHVGVAVASRSRILALRSISVPNALRGPDAVTVMALALREIHDIVSLVNGVVTHIAVEGQTVYPASSGKTVRPQDLIRLAQVAGAALAHCTNAIPSPAWIECPEPVLWKGQVPKAIHQVRTLNAYGGETAGWKWVMPKVKQKGIVVMANPVGIVLPGAQWTHVLDALGLARWAAWESRPGGT